MSERVDEIEMVDQLADQMKVKLRQNAWREHWSEMGFEFLLRRLREEVDELAEAIDWHLRTLVVEPPRAHRIASEAADVANFAGMIADNALRSVEMSAEGQAP